MILQLIFDYFAIFKGSEGHYPEQYNMLAVDLTK